MTLAQFQSMDYLRRLQAATKAVCVAGRDEEHSKVLLFQLHGFYVEVYYNKHKSYISEISGFDDLDQLEPYLKKINIEELVTD